MVDADPAPKTSRLSQELQIVFAWTPGSIWPTSDIEDKTIYHLPVPFSSMGRERLQ